MTDPRLLHVCEKCGRTEALHPDDAHAQGWDYPPRMGAFAVVSPRTCPSDTIEGTLWWRIAIDRTPIDALTEGEFATLARIQGEPESILLERHVLPEDRAIAAAVAALTGQSGPEDKMLRLAMDQAAKRINAAQTSRDEEGVGDE